jgi:hypothetical protein
VSEPTKPSWDDLSAFLTPMQIARLRMLESASTLPNRRSSTAIPGQTWEHTPVEPQHRPD